MSMEPSWLGLLLHERDSREVPDPFHYVRTQQVVSSLQPWSGSLLEPGHVGTLILDFSASEKEIFIFHKPSSAWYLVIAAQTNSFLEKPLPTKYSCMSLGDSTGSSWTCIAAANPIHPLRSNFAPFLPWLPFVSFACWKVEWWFLLLLLVSIPTSPPNVLSAILSKWSMCGMGSPWPRDQTLCHLSPKIKMLIFSLISVPHKMAPSTVDLNNIFLYWSSKLFCQTGQEQKSCLLLCCPHF